MSYIQVPVGLDNSLINIDIHIGYAMYGEFSFALYDENGRNPKEVFSGINSDNIPDKFSLYPNAVVNRYLRCFARVYQQTVQPNQRYALDVSFEQSGLEIHRMSATGLFSGQVESFMQVIKFV